MALYAFDGTWSSDEEDPSFDTNVVKFVEAYQRGAKKKGGGEYVSGVGTRFGFFGKIVGGLTGAGGRQRIEEMYEELEENYADGDPHIDIIGFSRGAALALHFANVVAKKGVRDKNGKRIIPEIRFLGLWDTVASFGIPIDFILPFQEINLGFKLTVPSNVRKCFHALALNERRQSFDVTRLDEAREDDRIRELWFRGVHSDVGGGNGNTGLSSISLSWMFENAIESGLPIEKSELKKSKLEEQPTAPISDNKDLIINPPRKRYAQDQDHPSVKRTVLQPGQKRSFTIVARDRYCWSKIHLVEGGRYRFVIPPKQKWTDSKIKCGPEGWKTKDLYWLKRTAVRIAEKRRRHRKANWFEIIGALGKSDDRLIRIVAESKKSKPWTCPVEADLYGFANDVRLMYYNNKGSMKITIERVS